eukprot:15474-Heterococcus_DN1.PRE.2
MEGYDGRRVLAALDVPDRYAVVIAIATGYEDDSKKPSKPSRRLPADEVLFSDRFGQHFQQPSHSTISANTADTSSSSTASTDASSSKSDNR